MKYYGYVTFDPPYPSSQANEGHSVQYSHRVERCATRLLHGHALLDRDSIQEFRLSPMVVRRIRPGHAMMLKHDANTHCMFLKEDNQQSDKIKNMMLENIYTSSHHCKLEAR
jgi:hypothetical protein